MSTKGGGSNPITGYRYYMALLMGLCRGPINELVAIRVGDIQAYSQDLEVNTTFDIDQPNLFGGDDKEGGIKGTAFFALGASDQVIPASPRSFFSGSISEWRGVTTLFYYGLVCSNNPYPKSWKFRVRRYTAGWYNGSPWYDGKALILMEGTSSTLNFTGLPANGGTVTVNGTGVVFTTGTPTGFQVAIGADPISTAQAFADLINANPDTFFAEAAGENSLITLTGLDSTVTVSSADSNITTDTSGGIYAMNPAHIIYECATNPSWGRGLPTALIDDTIFRAAADTLHSEGFGLCIRWNREEDIDKFIQTIVNHIGGALYIDRTTGLLTLKLIRDDYDPDNLAVFNFNSGLLDITDDQLSSTDTSFNEIVVRYHDVLGDIDAQVRIQDLGSIQSLGCTISTVVEYLGCPTSTLALRLAQRDLEMQSRELRRLTVKLDRAGWLIAPGSVFRIQAPSRGITDIVLRAGKVEDSKLDDGTIVVTAVQDIFSLPDASYIGIQNNSFVPPDKSAVAVATRRIEEMTWRDLAANLTTADLATIEMDAGAIKVLAKRPSSASIDYVISTAVGTEGFVQRGANSWEPIFDLTAAIGFYDTAITFTPQDGVIDIAPDVVLGSAALIDDEYVRIDAVDFVAGTATIARGVVDTIPAEHSIGADVWFEEGRAAGDGREYVTSEVVHVKLLTRTSSAILAESTAPTDDITIGGRQGRPYPPGDVRVNTARFGEVGSISGDIELTWTHRDRLAEGDFLLEHEAASTGPEAGTTYTVRVYDGVTLLRTASGITGTSYTYDTTMISADGDPAVVTFELESVRDSLVSWQKYRFDVTRSVGFDFGFDDDFDGGI